MTPDTLHLLALIEQHPGIDLPRLAALANRSPADVQAHVEPLIAAQVVHSYLRKEISWRAARDGTPVYYPNPGSPMRIIP